METSVEDAMIVFLNEELFKKMMCCEVEPRRLLFQRHVETLRYYDLSFQGYLFLINTGQLDHKI